MSFPILRIRNAAALEAERYKTAYLGIRFGTEQNQLDILLDKDLRVCKSTNSEFKGVSVLHLLAFFGTPTVKKLVKTIPEARTLKDCKGRTPYDIAERTVSMRDFMALEEGIPLR